MQHKVWIRLWHSWVVVALLGFLGAGQAAEFFVAVDGKSDGDGTQAKPVDLATALSSKTPARPGDTLWLRGGTYRGIFTSTLAGSETRPITLRQYSHERATIDGSLTIQGGRAVYWGFEVMNSDPDRISKERPHGVNVFGPYTKCINLIVHDTGVAFGCWSPAWGAEIYGCLIYHNGYQGAGKDRGHGHAIYTQNETITKRLMDNIMFDQFGYGIHAYTQGGEIKNYQIEGNISFNNGSATRENHRYDNILVGGFKPAEGIVVISNYTYTTWGRVGKNVQFNYSAKHNKDLTCRDNYFVGGAPVLIANEWEKVVLTGNTLVGLQTLVSLGLPTNVTTAAYQWDHNTYAGCSNATPFKFQGQLFDLAGWKSTTGLDQNSQFQKKLNGTQIFIRPNQYEPGRASIAVYNWDRAEAVAVDLKALGPRGAKCNVVNVLDYFGKPVATGTYAGPPLRLPLKGTATGPEFNAFVVFPAN